MSLSGVLPRGNTRRGFGHTKKLRVLMHVCPKTAKQPICSKFVKNGLAVEKAIFVCFLAVTLPFRSLDCCIRILHLFSTAF